MRIVHVCGSIDPAAGGPAVVLKWLAIGLAQRGHEVVAVTADAPENVANEARELSQVGAVLRACGPAHGPFAKGRHTADALRREINPATDVVHIHGLWQHTPHAACRLARKRGVPYVVRPCGMLDPWSIAQGALKKRLFLRLIAATDLRNASRVHFTAPLEQTLTENLGIPMKGVVIPNPIDRAEFEPPPPPGALRVEHRLGDRPIVAFLSRIHPKKGPEILIKAFARGAPENAALVIIGDGEPAYVEGLHALARDEGIADRVLFTGILRGRERIRALADADLFCLPSYQENFGVAVIEACAAGVPVLTSDKVNTYPMILEAGVGRIEPVDIERFTAGIRDMLADREALRRLGARARKWALETYDRERVMDRVIEMYESVRLRGA